MANISRPDDRALLEALKKVSELKRTEVPMPEDDELAAKLEEEARRKYGEDRTSQQWASVAERIGNALTNLGVAKTMGKSGADLSRANLTNPTSVVPELADESRFQLQGDLAKAAQMRGRAKTAKEREQELANQNYMDSLNAAKLGYETEKFKYGQGMDAYLQSLRDATAFNRSEMAADKQAKRQEKAESEFNKREELKSIRDAIAQRRKELESATSLANQYSQYEDLDKKSQQALDRNMAEVAAKAGITPEILEQIKKDTESKGWLWNSEDPKAAGKEISKRIGLPLQQSISDLEQRQKELLSGNQPKPMVQSEQPNQFPMTIYKDGAKAEVKDVKELEEAMAEGWTTSAK